MGHKAQDNYYDDDYYDDEYERPRKKSGVGTVLLIIGVLFIVGICILGVLASLLMPALFAAKARAGKTKCTNNLRSLGIACILYSHEKRFFPHMTALKEENNAEQISDVYRTLVQGRYVDNPEVYVCPNSEDISFNLELILTKEEAKAWSWNGEKTTGEWACKDSSSLSVFDNDELSYTYRRGVLNGSSARSDQMLAADKRAGASDLKPGNHRNGYNVVFVDGHAEFIPFEDKEVLDKMYQQLRMENDTNPH